MEDGQTLARPQPQSGRRYLLPVGIALVSLFLVSAGFIVGGEPGKFLLIGLAIAPLMILAVFAYNGTKSLVAAMFSYVWLMLLMLAFLYVAFATVLPLYIKNWDLLLLASKDPALIRNVSASDIFAPGASAALLGTLLLLFISSFVSVAMLARPVRVIVSRIVPIDPDNFVHKIALPALTLLFLSSMVPLIALGGRPPILERITNGDLARQMQELGFSVGPLEQIYQFVWTIPVILVAAGWPMIRTFRAALVRLGMVRPSLVQVFSGIGLGVALAGIGAIVLDPAIYWLWTALGWPTTNTTAFYGLMSNLITPVGVVVVGVTAGVGEEMAVRGLLQPRLGLIASNLLFTSLHASQYSFDGLLSVFIIGLVLGIIRSRSNTTTSAIVHGVYDFTLLFTLLLSTLQPH